MSDSTILFKKLNLKSNYCEERTKARGWTYVKLKRGNNIIKSVKFSQITVKKEQSEGVGNKANKTINIKNVKLLIKT